MSEIGDFVRGIELQFPELVGIFVDSGGETYSVKLGDRYFVIESLIGRGGQAQVLRCQGDGNSFALKMALSVPDPVDAARFEREFVVLRYFHQPALVRVFEFGVFENTGIPWMTMEYLEGESLRTWLESNPVRSPEAIILAVEAVMEIALTLAALHEMNLIHRDIKPDNIIVRPASDPQFTLVDFGICRAPLGIGVPTDPRRAPGTPPYMPHEQWSGMSSSSSDQFALAVTLYEWLTREYPYHVGLVPTDVRLDSGVRPRLASKYNRLIPKSVALVIDRMLEKDESRRYATLIDAATELGIAIESMKNPLKPPRELTQSLIETIASTGVIRRQATHFRSSIAPLLADHFVSDRRSQAHHLFDLSQGIRVAQEFCKRLTQVLFTLHGSLDYEEESPEWISSDHFADARLTTANVIKILRGIAEDLEALATLEWLLDIARMIKCDAGQCESLLSTWKHMSSQISVVEIRYRPTIGQFLKLLGLSNRGEFMKALTNSPSADEIESGEVCGILSKKRFESVLDPVESVIAKLETLFVDLAKLDRSILLFNIDVRRLPPVRRWWRLW